ncbi:MAG: AAA family ATPase [Candidatus Parcubacteria bacterium]|nr:AAA family ATPase [Leptolyngbyaceae cyanobacterium LF-bin-113]
MTSLLISHVDEINAALLSHNPFSQPPTVLAQGVWGKGFPDVETLNAHASNAVFKALEEIRVGLYPTTSILITAPPGTGKTHIISRIRHRLQDQGGALFILANKFDNINQVKQGFQQIVADSLSNIGSQETKQWQELATSMANDVFKNAKLDAQIWEPKNLVKKIESSDEQQISSWVNKLTKSFCKIKTVQDHDVVRAIFWTLAEDQASYASNWLAGKEIAQFKANELRLPSQNQSFDTVLQILALISEYNELLICFDELDVHEVSDAGFYKAQVVAGLVKELLENLKRGVILSVMMPGLWKEKIREELPIGVSNKMTTYCPPLDLRYLDSDSTVELVSVFLKDYYEARELIPPNPVYPFNEEQLRAIGHDRPTVQDVLKWCRENCKLPTGTDSGRSEVETDPVELAFTSELSEDIKNRLDNNYFLADALLFGFQPLIGETVEGVTVKKVVTGVGKKGKKDDYLNFKILGEEGGNTVSIGVAVLQYEGGKALGAGFKRLLDEEGRFELTRGCLVRSKDKPINNHFKKTYLEPLKEKGGEFAELLEKEVKSLVAIRAVHQKRESNHGVTEEQILKFIVDKGSQYWLGIHNPLLKEILSNPSCELDNIEDEPETSEEITSAHSDDAEVAGLEESEAKDLEELMVHA